MAMSIWEVAVGAFACGSGAGLAGAYVWAFFTAKARDETAVAEAPTQKAFVTQDGRRFVTCPHGWRRVGEDCDQCILARADSNFSLAAQCPKCRVVAVHNVVRWEHAAYPMWSPETGFTKAGEHVIGCVRGCVNCGHEWFQK